MMKCMKAFLIFMVATAGLLLEAADLKIPFSNDEVADWSKTDGATFSFKDQQAVLDGTNSDSKIWRLIELEQGKKYDIVVTALGPVSIRLTNGKWSKEDTYLTLNFNNRDYVTKTIQFQLPETLFKQQFLVIQVAAKGHAEIKEITFREVNGPAGASEK